MDLIIGAVILLTVCVVGWVSHLAGANQSQRHYGEALANARIREARLRRDLERVHQQLADIRSVYRPGSHP